MLWMLFKRESHAAMLLLAAAVVALSGCGESKCASLNRSLEVAVAESNGCVIEGAYVTVRAGQLDYRPKNHNDPEVFDADLTHDDGKIRFWGITHEIVTVDASAPLFNEGRRTLALPITSASGHNKCFIRLYRTLTPAQMQ